MSEYEERLWNYQTAMAMARQMLSQGIITGKEYAKIDATIAKKYLGNGSRYKEIVSLNGLKSNVIYSGMKLKIPNK